jgi:hypothetical protein
MTKGQMLVGLYYFVRYNGVCKRIQGCCTMKRSLVGSAGFPVYPPSKEVVSKFYTFTPPASHRKKFQSPFTLSSTLINVNNNNNNKCSNQNNNNNN